jgi:hypothetical protein
VVVFDYHGSNDYAQMLHVFIQSAEKHIPDAEVVVHEIDPPAKGNKITSNFAKLKKQFEIVDQEIEPEFILCDSDMVITGDISDAFEDKDFDITFTTRTQSTIPINVGVLHCRSSPELREFFKEWYDIAELFLNDRKLALLYLLKHKGINQAALGKRLQSPVNIRIKYLPCAEYNACDEDWSMLADNCKAIHLKNRVIQNQLLHGGDEVFPDVTPHYFQYKTVPSLHERTEFHKRTGYRMGIADEPVTFNEKVTWKKHNDRNPLIALTSDKYRARDYVSEKGFPELLTPLLFVGDRLIKGDLRPGIVKANNAAARSYRFREGDSEPKMRRRANVWMRKPYGRTKGEWAYQCIPPKILIEEMISSAPAPCIKALCFHGEPEYFYYLEYGEHFKPTVLTMYDKDWKIQDVNMGEWTKKIISAPEQFEYIKKVCRTLSADFQFVRIDLMINEKGTIYFSELTHYPTSGMMRFDPPEWDKKLGALWNLSTLSH